MKNKTSKKYDILMIVWGLSLGVVELLLIHLGFFDRINISFIKAPYAKKILILAIVSLCFRVITYLIQQPYKQQLENKNKIMRNSNLSLRLILKFEQKYKHLDGYIEYAHLLLCQLNIV